MSDEPCGDHTRDRGQPSAPGSDDSRAEAAGPGTADSPDGLTVWAVGHSSYPAETFLALLLAHRIEVVADVRRFPGSRKHPHFGAKVLKDQLASAGIGYEGFPELGGRRTPRPDSHNTAWRNLSFRGYADYMETSEFRAGLARLLRLAEQRRVAIMCSEALWWQCHRALIADALKVIGVRVLHIASTGEALEHPFTSAARIRDGALGYEADGG